MAVLSHLRKSDIGAQAQEKIAFVRHEDFMKMSASAVQELFRKKHIMLTEVYDVTDRTFELAIGELQELYDIDQYVDIIGKGSPPPLA